MTTYYPINENLARASHDMRSMSTYPDGYATREYRASVDKSAALVEEKKQKVSPYYHEKLDALLDSYARRLAQWTDDQPERRKLPLCACVRCWQLPGAEEAEAERP